MPRMPPRLSLASLARSAFAAASRCDRSCSSICDVLNASASRRHRLVATEVDALRTLAREERDARETMLAPPTLRKSAMGRSRRGWSRANPRTTPGSVGGRGGRDGREAERPSFPGVGPPGNTVGVRVRVGVIREETGGVTRTRRAHVIAPTDGGRQGRHDEWAPRTSTGARSYECPSLSRPLRGSREATRREHRARVADALPIRPRPRLREASIPDGAQLDPSEV